MQLVALLALRTGQLHPGLSAQPSSQGPAELGLDLCLSEPDRSVKFNGFDEVAWLCRLERTLPHAQGDFVDGSTTFATVLNPLPK